ncbi:hypothetical protein AB6A40_007356 [Gnathostoma spinigerum]|uniref:G-protein coupled receptors family 1 profile domain-containing protein n=1 Tax=Gnathostoma spinigerum TaxID=75299 RepID=A0ABD6EVP7_9BILA
MFKYAECVVLYVLPLVLLTILYSIMGRMLWGNSKTIANERQQLAVLRLRRSVVRMLIISILIYFVCYSPLQGIFITEVIMKKHLRIGHVMRLILNALSFSSSAANPIIYIVCCRHFRSRFFDAIRICVSIPCFWRPSPFRSADFSTRNNSASPYTSLKMKFGAHIEHIRSDKSQKSSTKKDFVRVSRWSPSVRLIGRTHSSNSLSRMDE